MSSKVNNAFVVQIYLTTMMANFALGFALAEFNVTGAVLASINGWSDNITVMITSFGILGLMVGALTASYILPVGRIKAAHIANLLIVLSGIPMMFNTITTFTIGRLLLGLGAGIHTVVSGVYMNETAP
jgi:MFS family permease